MLDEFSLVVWDENTGGSLSIESFMTRFFPDNNFFNEEHHVQHTTINNFYGGSRGGNGRSGGHHHGGGSGRSGGHGRGGNVYTSFVEVHRNNLKQYINDHIKSQVKKGCNSKNISIKKLKNGDVEVITRKGKDEFQRIFNVTYF